MLKALLENRREIVRALANRLSVAAAVWLAVGLGVSASVVWAFAELADGVVEGESRAFDRVVLLWIHDRSPEWLDGPMRLVTALGYYWVVLPLLAAVVLAFYLKGWTLAATLLVVSTRSEEHTSELQSRQYLVCRLLLVKKKESLLLILSSC